MKKIIKKNKAVFGAIIVAAGKSSRMQGIDKQLLEINGIPALTRSILAFQSCKQIKQITVVCREDMMGEILDMVYKYNLDKVGGLVSGGETRQQSVFKGIAELKQEITHCIIHDGARPFVSSEVIERCITDVIVHKAVTAAVKVKDTIKQGNAESFIDKTLDRENLYIAQTPQMFELD
ncbi:MAG: IspD/TarI family cytidylyltransferase, partial [Oscillospiraceae bacterium]